MMQAMCKMGGCLVIAKFDYANCGESGKCPLCGGSDFRLRHGWIECHECLEFAIDKGSYDRMTQPVNPIGYSFWP